MCKFSYFPQAIICCAALAAAAQSAEAEIPAYFDRLIRDGVVEFNFYGPGENPTQWPGSTDFRLGVKYGYQFQYSVEVQRRRQRLIIRPQVNNIRTELKHTMHLPVRLKNSGQWENKLVRHEFDHVACSTDPRARMLVEHLLGELDIIIRDLDPAERVDNEYIQKIVEEEIDSRHEAVLALMRENYRMLDKLSNHGRAKVPEREGFFRGLYTKANLDAARFPYTEEALGLFGKGEFRQIELLYDYAPIYP